MTEQPRHRARVSLGYFDTPELARQAVLEAQSKLGAVASQKARSEAIAPDPVSPHTPQLTSRISGASVTFGAIGDSHLCSNYERNDILEALYDIYASEGITDVYHTGNYIDGEAKFNVSDIHTHGMDNQIAYFCRKYPLRAGITTYYIAGDDHEGWYSRLGINIGKHTEDIAKREGRNDLRYLGYMESDVALLGGVVKLRVLHAGGGSGAAISLTSQRIVESYHPKERPHILLVGHYHKSEYLPDYKGVHIIQTGCTQEQTPFMRKKRLAAHLGGWIVKVTVMPDGGLRVAAEFISFEHRSWVYR